MTYLKSFFVFIVTMYGLSANAAILDGTCQFNGQIIPNDTQVVAYQNSTVPIGEACVSENRLCVDGILYGSFAYATCEVAQNASCLFNGVSIAHEETVVAYHSSSVAFGVSCNTVAEVRTCNNGVLTGSAQYSSCNSNSPRACLFNGVTLDHGDTVTAFLESTSQYGGQCRSEDRTCNDGTLSGTYQFSACNIDQPASCLFDGRNIAHGETVNAFAQSSVMYGSQCTQQSRTCDNGTLSGSYNFSSCTVGNPANCSFDGRTVVHGESVTAFESLTVDYGQSCLSQARSCNNGLLSGSYSHSSCSVNPAPPVEPPPVEPPPPAPLSCSINGKTVQSGDSITLFQSASVPYGSVCQSETRNCVNGVLSGSAQYESCIVQPKPPINTCDINNIIWEFPNVCRGNWGMGVGYFKSRVSRDGGKTWTVIMKNRLPDDLKQIWGFMVNKYGYNQCKRPNVQYVPSVNKKFVVMKSSFLPSCEQCKFVEVETPKKTCHKNKHKNNKQKNTTKKSVFMCKK